jgi:hypothetical protein
LPVIKKRKIVFSRVFRQARYLPTLAPVEKRKPPVKFRLSRRLRGEPDKGRKGKKEDHKEEGLAILERFIENLEAGNDQEKWADGF